MKREENKSEINQLIQFYKKTSQYTDLGLYKDFATSLPNDISELCYLQRIQIISPYDINKIVNKKNTFYGDMTQIPSERPISEDDVFTTAQSIISELLRRNPDYSKHRLAKEKIHIECRGQAILLTSILKAKGIPARCRSGFVDYIHNNGIYVAHWIVEYFDENLSKWILVDPDMFYPGINISFDLCNVPNAKFICGAEAYLKIRNGTFKDENLLYNAYPEMIGIDAAIRIMFYDFYSLLNNEIILQFVPKYIAEKKFKLAEIEYAELDVLAKLLLNPNENFKELCCMYEKNNKFQKIASLYDFYLLNKKY